MIGYLNHNYKVQFKSYKCKDVKIILGLIIRRARVGEGVEGIPALVLYSGQVLNTTY